MRIGATRRWAKPAVCGPSRRGEQRELRGRVGKRARCSDTDSLWAPSKQARWSVGCLRSGDSLRCTGYLPVGSVVLMVLMLIPRVRVCVSLAVGTTDRNCALAFGHYKLEYILPTSRMSVRTERQIQRKSTGDGKHPQADALAVGHLVPTQVGIPGPQSLSHLVNKFTEN
jgi:hypothetical protein